ncbi:hypothetical protein DW085_04160 [Clostridium sp. AF50-3]|nr:hypothetical protein DW085_04160 [Clostridium sp. AF50-3]
MKNMILNTGMTSNSIEIGSALKQYISAEEYYKLHDNHLYMLCRFRKIIIMFELQKFVQAANFIVQTKMSCMRLIRN